MTDICIIGGGASGMMAAIKIAKENPSLNIILIEKKEKLGSKIYATGNGRCNITNTNCHTFGDTSKDFRNIGVEIKVTDEGRAYPVSEQAADVVFALENAVKAYGVEVILNTFVTVVEKNKNGKYKIRTEGKFKKEILAHKVVIATGGKAAAAFGTTGDGYKLATALGHKVNKVIPALVPIECENATIGFLPGVRAKGKVTLYRKDFFVHEEQGEIQFTKDGLSGICIFNMSSFIRISKDTKFNDYYVEADFISQYKDMEILHILSIRRNINGLKTVDLFNSIVNSKLAHKILKKWSDKFNMAREIDNDSLKCIVDDFRHVRFNVTGVKGWKEAQCTAGGVDLDEFNSETMESISCPGIYFIGEVIDYQGPCGGYNLENAWETARKAGKAICTEYMK